MTFPNFIFTELAEGALIEGRPFDGMAAGEFVDMWGREVEIKSDDFPAYVKNTKAAIQNTRTENGEVVGLPIDAQGHENGDGAGWIMDVYEDFATKPDGQTIPVVRFLPKWTEIGRDLIAKGIRRMFSPTVNIKEKIILGGSLTNWPATRDAQGKVLLRPIEMAMGLYQIEEQTMEDENQVLDEAEEVETEPVAEEAVELETTSAPALEVEPEAEPVAELQAAELSAQVRDLIADGIKRGVAAELARIRKESEISDFCAGMSALPVPADDLAEFLTGLSDAQREKAQGILTAIAEKGLIDFAERGHSKRLTGRAELEAVYKPILRGWIESGRSLEEFFAVNPELGAQGDYNLTEFTKE